MTILEGIFLRVQGPEPHIDAIIFPSDPVRPGDSATLQCSVLSEYQNKICPEEPGVYWFKTRSDQSHPSFIYAHGSNGDECKRTSFTSQINCCKTAATITDLRSQQRDEDSLVYSAPTFTKRKADRGARTDAKAEVEDSVYSGVRISGLD
ncbi:hypothetical protein LDENG_00271110 [Lucifuga dentata]|nr:hypothetical protein LDENG_00271110 [Lucifuga dentata]